MDNEGLLLKLNEFTRRSHSLDEVYIFNVTLCDNEVDRDIEQFSLNSLKQMESLFVGKTGIFDHNPKGSNQAARIFATEVISDTQKVNSLGEPYSFLKGYAYMIRTSTNSDLILEIDGGIKKEVSVNCLADTIKCSICGNNIKKKPCAHIKGNTYNNKKCYAVLDDISDAYEWSFVAIPAQIKAGVSKGYCSPSDTPSSATNTNSSPFTDPDNPPDMLTTEMIFKELKSDIIRLGVLAQPKISDKSLESIIQRMQLNELYQLKKAFLSEICGDLKPQISAQYNENLSNFKLAH